MWKDKHGFHNPNELYVDWQNAVAGGPELPCVSAKCPPAQGIPVQRGGPPPLLLVQQAITKHNFQFHMSLHHYAV
jgi:hypothetical protein